MRIDDTPAGPPPDRPPVWAFLAPAATWCTGRYAPPGGHPVTPADVYPTPAGPLCMPCIREHDRRHPAHTGGRVHAPDRARTRAHLRLVA